MDLGGHRFFTKDKDVMKLWETILPLGNENNKKVLLERSRVSHIFYNRKFFDYPVNLSFKTIKNLELKDTINFYAINFLVSLIYLIKQATICNLFSYIIRY